MGSKPCVSAAVRGSLPCSSAHEPALDVCAMSGPGTIAVVGAGQAGAEVCTELRRQGYAGRIVLIGEESRPPYRRPPLSKAYLAGTADEQSLYLLSPAAIERHRIE